MVCLFCLLFWFLYILHRTIKMEDESTRILCDNWKQQTKAKKMKWFVLFVYFETNIWFEFNYCNSLVIKSVKVYNLHIIDNDKQWLWQTTKAQNCVCVCVRFYIAVFIFDLTYFYVNVIFVVFIVILFSIISIFAIDFGLHKPMSKKRACKTQNDGCNLNNFQHHIYLLEFE